MKSTLFLLKISLVFSLFVLVSCNREDDESLIDTERFYRMEAFETAVIPDQRQVSILFQVKNYEGDGVSDLTETNFIVTENGGRLDSEANLKIAPDSIPYVLSTVLLLDVSTSVQAFIPQIKEAAKSLVDQKLPNQEIAIYTFDSQANLLIDFSSDNATLKAAIDEIAETGLQNSTNLYGAIMEVAELWEDNFSIDQITDGSLIIFTDGRHNATPALTLSDATAAVNGKKVYVAALDSPDLDAEALKQLASASDHYFLADEIGALEGTFTSIQTEIQRLSNSIYFLFYQSPITDPTPYVNDLQIEILDNTNPNVDGKILEEFNSEGFGN